jgi:hypothetical protein
MPTSWQEQSACVNETVAMLPVQRSPVGVKISSGLSAGHVAGPGPIGTEVTHERSLHPVPAPQGVSHALQCALSLRTSTQRSPQSVSGDGHVLVQPFDTQASPAAHAWPQLPQFAESAAVKMHAPPQNE